MLPSLNKAQLAEALREAATRIEEEQTDEEDGDTIAIALTKSQWGVVLGSFDSAISDLCSLVEETKRYGNGSPFKEDSVESLVEQQDEIREIEHLMHQQLGRYEMGSAGQDAA